MPLGIRIFLVYVLFIGLTGYFVLNTVMEEIRPGVRQSTEETLIDTANLMAEILRDDFKAGRLWLDDTRRALGALALLMSDDIAAEGYARLLDATLTPPRTEAERAYIERNGRDLS